MTYLLLVLASLIALGCYGCKEGDVRLAGGSDTSGRVEFCHGGEWGTVCDDDFDNDDARVVCRQLGLPTNVTLALAEFGGGSGEIFLDNVECSGWEGRLENCRHRRIGAHDCRHHEDVGVICGTGQDGEKQCGYEDSESELTREEVERFGNCVPYQARDQTIPCDTLYTPGVDHVFVSYQRTSGNIDTYLDTIQIAAGVIRIFSAVLQGKCYNPFWRIICQYYLPPCGNSTTFQPPASVCMETCNYLREICPNEWNYVISYVEKNKPFIRNRGLSFINCNNTGEYLNPLPHCCSDVGIDIPCNEIDGSGELVPDPSCPNSTVPDFSTQAGSLAITVGSVCAAVAALLLMMICAVTWMLIRKYRQTEKKKQEIPHPRSLARLNSPHDQEEALHYVGNGDLLKTPPLVPPNEALVNSKFVHQMNEENLLIPKRNIRLQDCVGQGEFGIVYSGSLSGWRGKDPEPIAVKTLKGAFSASELNKIVEECLKMSKFNHPNVMRLVGVCIDAGESPYIVMPFMTHGSLLSYLRKHRAELTIANNDNMELVTTAQKKLLSICLQIAKGMSYLANEKFVHRDLAARNCMIDNNFVIKVADFGLTEDIYAKKYFRQTKLGEEGGDQVKLPVRWMALESLNDGVFTEKTDVWSFGVTCWEVFSSGKSPYPGVDPFALIKYLERGERLEKPASAACSQEIYRVMKECWKELPDSRPTFSDLVMTISTSLERIAGYLDLSASPLIPPVNSESGSYPATVTVTDN